MAKDEKFDDVGSTATNVAYGFTMVAVGDLMMRRPITTNARNDLSPVVEGLRSADVTFGNLETNIFDIRGFKGSPQADHGGSYHVGERVHNDSCPPSGRIARSANLLSISTRPSSMAPNRWFAVRRACRIATLSQAGLVASLL